MRILDEAAEASNDRKQGLLNQAEEELDFALSEEGASRASESVRAHIEFQRGRLAYLHEQYEQAAELFSLARRALATAGQTDQVACAEEFLLCIEVCRRWKLEGDERPQARVQPLLEVLDPSGFQIKHPLVQLMADLLRKPELSQTAQDGIIASKPVVVIESDIEREEPVFRRDQLLRDIDLLWHKYQPDIEGARPQQQPDMVVSALFAMALK